MSKKKMENNLLGQRLRNLRAATGKTWDALAAEIGIKRAMLYHVLAGRRRFGANIVNALGELEIRAGIRSRASVLIEAKLGAADIVSLLLSKQKKDQWPVTLSEINAGRKVVKVQYRRGSPPNKWPAQLTVNAANNADIWKMVGINNSPSDPNRFLCECVEVLKRTPEIIDAITPSSYMELMNAAMDLTFGLDWRKALE